MGQAARTEPLPRPRRQLDGLVEGALFPSVEGLDLTASVTLDGDEVKFIGQQGSRLFRRVKGTSAEAAP